MVGALVHEGRGSKSGQQGSDGCGYHGDSPLGDDFSELVQLYSRVWEMDRIGEPGDKP